ncbi:hypothetical protein AMTR_s00142p00111270 [Amborella trichopoda]|uniref:Reverse transcriptase zinc-binding domain-containing protein n=1 Tax=Amborella trichopoda TaxID=13333 RepID=W1PEM0_AMBTC|nr:hypothetical protein AMTR_s00142p00111270 [Amborella trichopoda]
MASLAWRILTVSDSLWVQFAKARYIKGNNIWQCNFSACAAWAWKGIQRGLGILKGGARILIGNGGATLFWTDPWLEEGHIVYIIGRRTIGQLGANLKETVASHFDEEIECWPLGRS